MSCWQDEIHLLGDFLKKLFVKWALSPKVVKVLFRTLDNLRKFAEIMDFQAYCEMFLKVLR